MRRLLSIILAVIMVCGTLMITDVTTLAAEPEAIQNISVTVPKTPEKGEVVSSVADITVGDQEPYTIESAQWSAWQTQTNEDLDVTQPCVAGGQYHLVVVLVAKTGYKFADDCNFTVVGNTEENGYTNKESDTRLELHLDWIIKPQNIEKVEVTLENAEAGKSTIDLVAMIPRDANYSLKGFQPYIYNDTTDSYEPFTGTFEKNHQYRIDIKIGSNDAEYGFVDTSVKLNGELTGWGSDGVYNLTLNYHFHTMDEISDVEITGAPTAEIGKDPVVTGVSVPQDAAYEVVDVFWYEEETGNDLQAGDKFEDGKAYYLVIQLKADTGFLFSNEQLIVDGVEADTWWPDNGDTQLTYEKRFTFKKQIKSVNVSDLTTPVAGQQPDTDVTITGEGVDIANATITWRDRDTYNPLTGTFPNKGVFMFCVEFTPLSGWEFADEMDVTLNGEKVFGYGDYGYKELNKVYSLGYETVKKVELTVEKPQAGQNPEDVKIKVLTDGVENDYTMWLYVPDVTKNNAEFFEGQFQDGKSYLAGIALVPTGDKVFDSNVEIILNGKKLGADDISNQVTYVMATYGPFTIGEVDKEGEIDNNAGGQGTVIESPKTGDSTTIMPLVVAMAISAAVIVVLPIYKKRREY